MVIALQQIELQFQLKHIQLQLVVGEQEQLNQVDHKELVVLMVQIQFFQQSHQQVVVLVE
jgi:hypothetical protein